MKFTDCTKSIIVSLAIGKSQFSLYLAIGFTLFLQFLTGIPNPTYFDRIDAHFVFEKLSNEIFDYPFWLQDLSHFPLFFCYAWLWSRYFILLKKRFTVLLVFVTIGYAIANELIQFFIPNRFPSAGDLIMNSLGALTGLLMHRKICLELSANKELK